LATFISATKAPAEDAIICKTNCANKVLAAVSKLGREGLMPMFAMD
jgi:hypothetical protein